MVRQHGAFIAARYSTDNQNPDTIEVQVERCTRWCRENNVPILGTFADEAISGMKETRPEYERMMRRLADGEADTVVIYDQSRMFRQLKAWFSFRDQLTAMGVRVVSVTQPVIGNDLRDPMNFLSEASMAMFNQIWALQSRQKTMEKMRFMAKNGMHTGGKPALGYKVENGKLIVDDDEAKIVSRIFCEYASGASYREIISGLNQDGIKTKRGGQFGTNSLHDLLKNEKYIGVLTYGASPYREDGTRNSHAKPAADAIRIENGCPAIVAKEVFDKVQQIMGQNRKRQSGQPPKVRDYPLKGKVFCAQCGAAMTISTSKSKGKEYYYYKCTGKKRTGYCDAAPIRADYLEQLVADAVRSQLGNQERVNTLIAALRGKANVVQQGAASALQAMIDEDKELSRKLENATEAVLSGLYSKALSDKITQIEQRREYLSRQMVRLKKAVDATAIPEAKLRELFDLIASGAMDDNGLILSVVNRVEISKDTIQIYTMLDPDPSPDPDKLPTPGELIKIDGAASGVPTVYINPLWVRITVPRYNAHR